MKDYRQNGYNTIAAVMLLLSALIRGINVVEVIKAVSELSKIYRSLPWQIYTSMIAEILLTVLMAAAGIFLLKLRDDLYSKAIFGVGAVILADYAIIVGYLFEVAGAFARSYLLRWQMILIYGSMLCYGLSFVLSGKYAMNVDDDPAPTNTSRWMQSPLTYISGIIFMIIAAIGLGGNPLDFFSTVESERWIQILMLIMDFLILLFAGMHLRKKETDAYLLKTDKPEIQGVPPFNANTYQPFQTDAQGFRQQQQAFGAGAVYGAQMYNAQQNGNPMGYGASQNNGPYSPGYGAMQSMNQNGAPNGPAPQMPVYGQAPAVDFSKGIDMPQKDLSKGIDMPQKDLSKGIDMPQRPDTSSTIDMPHGINVPPMMDIPEGDFDELLGYGRQQGYGKNEVNVEPADENQ